jgi:hypothetical protein
VYDHALLHGLDEVIAGRQREVLPEHVIPAHPTPLWSEASRQITPARPSLLQGTRAPAPHADVTRVV